MITFEQYVKEEKHKTYQEFAKDLTVKTKIENFNILKQMLEAAPFHFTLTAKTGVEFSEYTVIAKRQIRCDNIDAQLDETEFVVTYNPFRIEEVSIMYPFVSWNEDSMFYNGNTTDYTDLENLKFFYIIDQCFSLADVEYRLSPHYSLHSFFTVYNFYMSQTGTKVEKVIKTLEYVKPIWSTDGSNMWDAEAEKLLWKIKAKYQRNQMTKRDIIKGALIDL